MVVRRLVCRFFPRMIHHPHIQGFSGLLLGFLLSSTLLFPELILFLGCLNSMHTTTIRCGARYTSKHGNVVNLTYPLALLKFDEEGCQVSLIIPFFRQNYTLAYSQIEKVDAIKKLISKGISVVHKNTEMPNPIIFWTRHPDKLLACLKQKDR